MTTVGTAIRVVTVAREYGSGGREIATRLAGLLGWEFVDRQFIDDIARRAKVDPQAAQELDEQVDSWLARISKMMWAGSVEGFVSMPSDLFDADVMAELTRQVVLEAANRGRCVILGRGAHCILKDHPGVYHVFVYAARAERIARMRGRYASEGEAAAAIDRMDRARIAYVQHYYGCQWGDRHNYHVLVDSRIGDEVASKMLECAVRTGTA